MMIKRNNLNNKGFGFLPMLFASIFTSVVSFLVDKYTSKPEENNISAIDPKDYDYPTSKHGLVIPRIYGTRKVAGNVMWLSPITSYVSGGKTLYRISFAIAIHAGRIDRLKEIWYKGEPIWNVGANYNPSENTIGIGNATIHFHSGNDNQTPDSYISSHLNSGEVSLGYSGISYITFEDFELGEQPRLDKLECYIRNWNFTNGIGWSNIDDDINPISVIYDLLENDVDNIGLGSSYIDIPSFNTAASTLATEQLGLSIFLGTQKKAWDIIKEILKIIDGFIYRDADTDKFKIKLLRGDYNVSTLDTFDETDIKDFQMDFSDWQNIPTNISLTFNDISNNYQEKTISIYNNEVYYITGRIKNETYNYPQITKETVAEQVLRRIIVKKSKPLAGVSFALPYEKANNFRIGDVMKIKYAPYNLDYIVLRIISVSSGQTDDGTIEFNCIEDVFGDKQFKE